MLVSPRFALLLLVLLSFPAWAASTIPVTISNASGEHAFDLELAQTEADQERGLMFRRQIEERGGMIFPRKTPGPSYMWMKNTYIPLDLVFVGPDRKIIHIAAGAEPFDETPVGTNGPVAATLELKAGSIARDVIKVGDAVRYALPGS